MTHPRNVVLVDIPTYPVAIPDTYRELLQRRLRAEAIVREERLGIPIRRPGLTYSRGLLLVAASVQQRGHNVRYLVYPDQRDVRQFAALCMEADVLGITATTPTVRTAFELFKHAKRINPRVICVLGGPHATVMDAGSLQECPELDVVVPGTGEDIFAELVDHCDEYKDIAGIVVRRADTIQRNPFPQIRGHNRSSSLAPAYHLLSRNLRDYGHNIRTFDGCPYQCNFCVERVSWRGRKNMSTPDRVMEEVRLLSEKARPNTLIHFSDSVFSLDKDRTIEMCNRMQAERFKVVFSCDTRVDRVDEDIVRALARAGFVCIRLGVEVLDNTMLTSARKGILADQSLQAIETIRQVAPTMLIHAYMLTGLPESSQESLIQAAYNIRSLVETHAVDIIGNKMLVPYPGSPYFAHPHDYKMEILHHDWDRYDRLSRPVYRLENLSDYEIYFGFLHLESILLSAYEARVADRTRIRYAPATGLDYVYRSYVEQVGLKSRTIRLAGRSRHTILSPSAVGAKAPS